MYVLNNRASADDYTEPNTLSCPQTVKVNLVVANAAIYVQFGDPSPGVVGGAAAYGPERQFLPGFHNMVRRTETIRFRSVVSGRPAQVTVEALTPND